MFSLEFADYFCSHGAFVGGGDAACYDDDTAAFGRFGACGVIAHTETYQGEYFVVTTKTPFYYEYGG